MNTNFRIGVVVAIVLQISGFVWWTAQQAQTISILSVEVAALTSKASVVETTNVRRDITDLQNSLNALSELIKVELQELEDDVDEAESELWAEIEDIRNEMTE